MKSLQALLSVLTLLAHAGEPAPAKVALTAVVTHMENGYVAQSFTLDGLRVPPNYIHYVDCWTPTLRDGDTCTLVIEAAPPYRAVVIKSESRDEVFQIGFARAEDLASNPYNATLEIVAAPGVLATSRQIKTFWYPCLRGPGWGLPSPTLCKKDEDDMTFYKDGKPALRLVIGGELTWQTRNVTPPLPRRGQ